MDLNLLKELVCIDTSRPENKPRAVEAIAEAAKKRGLEVEVVEDKKGIPNVMVYGRGSGKKVLFVTHYDVVPPGDGWARDPFTPVLEDGKLYGRGAADDKSAIVAVLDALASVENAAVEPVLVVAGAEETGESEDFMKDLEGDLAVIVDSGPNPTIGSSGVLKWTIVVKGKQAHSAYPFLGRNALYDAAKIVTFVERLASFAEKFLRSEYAGAEHYEKLPVRPSATVLHTGSAWNIIPSTAEVHVSIRTVPEWNNDLMESLFLELLEEFTQENNIEYEVRKDIDMEAWVSEGEEIKRFYDLYREVTGIDVKPAVELGGTDGVHFKDRMPVVQFGPMRPENNIHGPNEFVYLKDVEMVEKVVREILRRGL